MSLSNTNTVVHQCPPTLLPPFSPSSAASDSAVYRPSTSYTVKHNDSIQLPPLHPSAAFDKIPPVALPTVASDDPSGLSRPPHSPSLRQLDTGCSPECNSALPSLSILGLLSLPTAPPKAAPNCPHSCSPPSVRCVSSPHTAVRMADCEQPGGAGIRGTALSTMATTTVTTTSCTVSTLSCSPPTTAPPTNRLSPSQAPAGPAPVKILPTPINTQPSGGRSESADSVGMTSASAGHKKLSSLGSPGIGWLTIKTMPLDGKLYTSSTATTTNIVNPPPMTSCLAFSSPACPSTMTTTTMMSSAATFSSTGGAVAYDSPPPSSPAAAAQVSTPPPPMAASAGSGTNMTHSAGGRVWTALANSLPPHLQLNVARKLQRLKPYQRYNLERVFQADPYPSPMTLKKLSVQLDLSISKIQVWFTNRRAKMKRDAWVRMQVTQVDD